MPLWWRGHGAGVRALVAVFCDKGRSRGIEFRNFERDECLKSVSEPLVPCIVFPGKRASGCVCSALPWVWRFIRLHNIMRVYKCDLRTSASKNNYARETIHLINLTCARGCCTIYIRARIRLRLLKSSATHYNIILLRSGTRMHITQTRIGYRIIITRGSQNMLWCTYDRRHVCIRTNTRMYVSANDATFAL